MKTLPVVDIICSDINHPVYTHLDSWCVRERLYCTAKVRTDSHDLRGGDFLFLVSCHKLISAEDRARYRYTLVLHASDLPKGRGMSPHIWQVLEGASKINVSLLDAADEIDCGAIWMKKQIQLDGHELADEINEKLFTCELDLMSWAIRECDARKSKEQIGQPTYYGRRTAEDSRIDPLKSIAEQFDLLRVSDTKRYPAFFEFKDHRYHIILEKCGS